MKGYGSEHFATFPPEIPRRCILAGCPEGGTVLDPFAGSGTTLAVAIQLGRRAIGIELNPKYVEMIENRLAGITPSLFAASATVNEEEKGENKPPSLIGFGAYNC